MRSMFAKIILYVILIGSAILYTSYFISMRFLTVKRERLVVRKTELAGKIIKILHISDIHSKEKRESKLFIWDKIKELSFDTVVITGDFIANKHTELLPHIPVLKAIAKNTPVFYVFGNHEMYEESEVRKLLESAGMIVLEDENVRLNIAGVDVNIIGIRDYYSIRRCGFGNIFELLKDVKPNEFNIVLSHQPQVFKDISQYNVDLMLSGHTHGGQVRFPFMPTLYAPGQGIFPKYGDGWYHETGSSLYISKGIGATVFPIRLFNRPEVTIIETLF